MAAPCRGAASFPQRVHGATELKSLDLLRWASRPHGEAPLWALSDQRNGVGEGMRHPTADAVALVARGIYVAADEQRTREARLQVGLHAGGEAPCGHGGLALVGGRTWRVPAARRPALDADRRMAPGHARVPCRSRGAGQTQLGRAATRQAGSPAHPGAGTGPRPQEQGPRRSDGTLGAPKKVQALWGDADESTRPPSET